MGGVKCVLLYKLPKGVLPAREDIGESVWFCCWLLLSLCLCTFTMQCTSSSTPFCQQSSLSPPPCAAVLFMFTLWMLIECVQIAS